jgi:uncharacterized protein YkwD
MPTCLPRVACVALAVVLTAFPGVAQAKPDDRDPILDRIDDVRASNGLRPFKFAPSLARSSYRRAKSLMRTNVFSHGNSIGGGGFTRHGEALAYHSGWQLNRGSTVGAWLNSSSHRALLLSRSLRYVGVGKARGRFGGRLSTIWVLRLGAH